MILTTAPFSPAVLAEPPAKRPGWGPILREAPHAPTYQQGNRLPPLSSSTVQASHLLLLGSATNPSGLASPLFSPVRALGKEYISHKLMLHLLHAKAPRPPPGAVSGGVSGRAGAPLPRAADRLPLGHVASSLGSVRGASVWQLQGHTFVPRAALLSPARSTTEHLAIWRSLGLPHQAQDQSRRSSPWQVAETTWEDAREEGPWARRRGEENFLGQGRGSQHLPLSFLLGTHCPWRILPLDYSDWLRDGHVIWLDKSESSLGLFCQASWRDK
ncbi:uncharacterized protein LOC123640511 [Lemur catta]|uniref:uncharacterized protein LOC123640511 n=1 Tax=Lemur catta TaxID=9447 RepID=UPI001E26AD07|nr:uncharacterized protein LOC123640511 [Lemur catta]